MVFFAFIGSAKISVMGGPVTVLSPAVFKRPSDFDPTDFE